MSRLTTMPKRTPELTPELRDFLDRAIIPALVEAYLAELEREKARTGPSVDSPPAASPPVDNT